MKQLTEDGLIPVSRISPSRSHSPISEMGKSRSPARGRVSHQPSVDDLENSACKLNPSVEGRILQITPEVNSENNVKCKVKKYPSEGNGSTIDKNIKKENFDAKGFDNFEV